MELKYNISQDFVLCIFYRANTSWIRFLVYAFYVFIYLY